jgi:hypothetical protein
MGASSEHWDGDRGLIQLANMLSNAAQASERGEDTSDKKEEIINFLDRSGWRERKAKDMIFAAWFLLEAGASPEVYEHGKHLAEDLYTSFRSLSLWSLLRRKKHLAR